MNKVYYLSTCDTCKKIFTDVGLKIGAPGFVFQDIKTQPIAKEQLNEMKKRTGSYEALFSRRAIKYKEWDLKNKHLLENDFRDYILLEYTFLKRPVVILGKSIFIGSEKKNIEALKSALSNK